MNDRVSQTILLCEDGEQERLIKAFMRIAGLETKEPMLKCIVASKIQHGGNDVYVLNRFPSELRACRMRQAKAKTLLIVVIDADNVTVDDRRVQLNERAVEAELEAVGPSEPVALLIPKQHVETWIRALLGDIVTEDEDCKQRKPASKEEINEAGKTLFQWSRPNSMPGPTCVPSLHTAFPEWRKIR